MRLKSRGEARAHPGSAGLAEDVQDPALSASPRLQHLSLNHKSPLRNFISILKMEKMKWSWPEETLAEEAPRRWPSTTGVGSFRVHSSSQFSP